jgi:protein-S-isoprenylcysteine O-methyltransferase Ste14
MNRPRIPKVVWLFVIAASLFGPAGTLAWPRGWLFFVEWVGGVIVTMRWLKRHDPALFEERARNDSRRADWPGWDKLFALVTAVAWYAWIVFMALDARRLHLSPLPVPASVVGAVVIPVGYLFAASALKSNTFGTTAVRLQPERNQRVVDSGPYAFIRHPIYTASIVVHVGTALVLGSGIGLALVVVLAGLLGVRAVLEERLLCAGLDGYADYRARVRWRLVPGIW